MPGLLRGDEARALSPEGRGRLLTPQRPQPPTASRPALAPLLPPFLFRLAPRRPFSTNPRPRSVKAAPSPSRASRRRRAASSRRAGAGQGGVSPSPPQRPSRPSAKQARDWSARGGGAGRRLAPPPRLPGPRLGPWPGRGLRGPARCVRGRGLGGSGGVRSLSVSAVGSQPSRQVPPWTPDLFWWGAGGVPGEWGAGRSA